MKPRPFSLYFHIPFCFHKCPYCDFNAYAVAEAPEKSYTEALLAELDFRAALPEWKGRVVQTIFFGGGTPSLFQPKYIEQILLAAKQRFSFQDNIEISLEANPGTVSFETLSGYYAAGVNRLSIGAQTFKISLLKILGRIHTPDQIEAAVENAIQAGFLNINLDLMFGIPGQTIADFQNDLAKAVQLGLAHISAYGLTIEKGTPYFSAHKRGDIITPPEEAVVQMMEELSVFLSMHGFSRYEISNFSKPGYDAKHNLAYWNGDDYIGIGAGAHSFIRQNNISARRWANYAEPAKYIESATAHGKSEGWHEQLNANGLIFEFFFLGLRKLSGVSLSRFTELFSTSIEQTYPGLIELLSDEGLLKVAGDNIALSEKGILVADSVIENFAKPESSVAING